jgi:hypothetical protein
MKFKDFGVKNQTKCTNLMMEAKWLLVAFWPFVLWAKSIGPQLNFL